MYVYSKTRKWWVKGHGWLDTSEALATGARSFDEFRQFKNPNDAYAHAKTDPDLEVTTTKKRLHGR